MSFRRKKNYMRNSEAAIKVRNSGHKKGPKAQCCALLHKLISESES